MSDITIKYKGQSIATMDATGSKTLNTQGEFCEGDIGVEYVKPDGPTGTKQISITQNGTTTEDVAAYANAEINVNVSGGGGSSTAAAGTVTLAENVQVPGSGESKAFPGIVFPFQPDLFVITLDRSAWDTKSPPSATTFYTVWMIKKTLIPPYRITTDISTDSYTGDYLTFVSANVIASSDVLPNAYALNGLNIIGQTYQPHWYMGADGKFYFSRYSTSSTAGFTTGKYNYFGIKM